jgi:hypothetical protein
MIGLLCFFLAVLASPFKSKLRLEAENAVLRHQLNVLRRKLACHELRPARSALPRKRVRSLAQPRLAIRVDEFPLLKIPDVTGFEGLVSKARLPAGNRPGPPCALAFRDLCSDACADPAA